MGEAPTIDSEAEFQLLAGSVKSATEPVIHGQDVHMAPVCLNCETGGTVQTNKERKGNITVKRHECEECEARGTSMTVAHMGNEPAKTWSEGDAKEVNLKDDEWAEYRGTF